ncbi:unnamed protein product [Rotaria sordida]|uniref:Reverse transcriptase domain-containing protein n=1 Tax=Rotaria sordida TaxID=392033 RepID=A0A815FB63_9BILA|nr:unnamed protein product [Rotaria sordida]CAF1326799.1 unnamed protein product [Rotaria sordida]
MIDTAVKFYQDLYDIKTIDTSIWNELFTDLPSLNPTDREYLEHDISYEECYNVLKMMPLGRVPGEDGITVEVRRYLFPVIDEYYVQMINLAKSNGQFHDGFLNAMLTLLKKEGNYNGSMKGFRPLSLMNIDYKILSKVLSVRLKQVLNHIIYYDQSCGIPGRTIHDNIHLIRSIIDCHSRRRDPIGIIQWNQEKAFDRVNHNYLFETLKQFEFGCSLSGGLYVICLEPLLHNIRKNARIPGVLPPRSEFRPVMRSIFNEDHAHVTIKLSAYADDVCTIVLNENDERETQAMFDLYNKVSGGKTNKDKTSIFWISDWLNPPSFQSKVEREYCTFLGVPIDTKGKMPAGELTKIISNHVGIQLRTFAPWVWTNLVPHFNHDDNFFGDVACHTAKWINKTGALTIDDTIRHFNADHFYDLLNDVNINAAPTILFYHQTKIIYHIDGFNQNVLLRKIKLQIYTISVVQATEKKSDDSSTPNHVKIK